MEVKQIYNMINEWQQELTGGAQFDDEHPWIVKEDLSNLVDVGKKVMNAGSVTIDGEKWRDNFVRSMIDRIGRMVFVERPYVSQFPDLRRDEWTYGSIMTKSRCKRFKAKPNPAWSLVPGEAVEQFAFEPPEVMTLFYNALDAWQVDCSFANRQLRSAFTSPREMDRFLSMIESAIQRSLDAQIESITSRTLNGLIAEKIYRGKAVVDLLAEYNKTVPAADALTAANCRYNVDFQRFMAYTFLVYKKRLAAATSWFIEAEEEGYDTQTPAERLRFALHNDFAAALDTYLQSETYHNEFTNIGSYDTVTEWQTSGSNTGFDFGATSRIYAACPSDKTHIVNRTHIVGIMWDWDAAMLLNTERHVESSYNSNGEYYSNFYKCETHSAIDLLENAVVFVIGEGTVPTITLSGTATAAVGASSTLTATTTGAGVSPTIVWSSSDTDTATVAAGVVTGVAAGTATITAAVTVDGTTYFDSVEFDVTATQNTKKK